MDQFMGARNMRSQVDYRREKARQIYGESDFRKQRLNQTKKAVSKLKMMN